MNSTTGKRLEISLNARPAAGIGAGDGQNAGKAVRSHEERRIGASM
jgi:hypothetical protein